MTNKKDAEKYMKEQKEKETREKMLALVNDSYYTSSSSNDAMVAKTLRDKTGVKSATKNSYGYGGSRLKKKSMRKSSTKSGLKKKSHKLRKSTKTKKRTRKISKKLTKRSKIAKKQLKKKSKPLSMRKRKSVRR